MKERSTGEEHGRGARDEGISRISTATQRGVATRRVAARDARPAAQAGAILANGTAKLFPRPGLAKVDGREYGKAQIGHSGSQHDLAGHCFRAEVVQPLNYIHRSQLVLAVLHQVRIAAHPGHADVHLRRLW